MKLVVRDCVECGACIDACPYALSTKILNCTHCNACVESCTKNAFYEVMPGIYAIDPEKCDGCGECFCPYDALEIKGYARKCDLCGGEPKCVDVCLKDLSIEFTGEEKAAMQNVLGWEKCSGDYESGLERLLPHEVLIFEEVRSAFKELVKESEVRLERLLEEYCQENSLAIPAKRKTMIAETLERELKGFSVLDPLLKDNELEEITVNGLDHIRVFHRKHGWLKTDLRFTSLKKITELINKISRQIGRRVSLQSPRLNAMLPDGSRLHAVIPPLTREPSLTIRKFNKDFFSPRELVRNNTLSPEAMAFLWLAMQCDLNVLVCGSTGSGKTTTLDCLASFIPLKERIIIVEEIPEVQLPHPHMVRLIVNPPLGIGMSELINDTLRMRPDRVVVGEVRTEEEVKAFLNSMMAGQGKGSLATFHALSCQEALNRLKLLGANQSDLNALDLVIVQRRWTQYSPMQKKSRELRRVLSISEILETGPRIVFEYDFTSDSMEKREKPKLLKQMCKSFKVSERELEKEQARRVRFLEKKPKNLHEEVEEMNRFIHGETA